MNSTKCDEKSNKCEKKHLGFKQLCHIIGLCRKNNVSRIRVGDIELSFFDSKNLLDQVQKQSDKEFEKEKDIDMRKIEAKVKDEMLQRLLIEDPVLYERLIDQGDIIDAGESNSETE